MSNTAIEFEQAELFHAPNLIHDFYSAINLMQLASVDGHYKLNQSEVLSIKQSGKNVIGQRNQAGFPDHAFSLLPSLGQFKCSSYIYIYNKSNKTLNRLQDLRKEISNVGYLRYLPCILMPE